MVIFLEIRYFKQSQSNFFNISILFQCKLCKVHTSHTLFTGLMVHRWSISATYMSLRHTCLSDTHVSRTHMSLGHIRPTWPNKVNRKDLPSMNVGISSYFEFQDSQICSLVMSTMIEETMKQELIPIEHSDQNVESINHFICQHCNKSYPTKKSLQLANKTL